MVIFAKGTKVTWHIVRARSGAHGGGSALFIQFDKASLKDGQEVILNAGIQALAVGAVAPLSDTDRSKDAATSAAGKPPTEPLAEGVEPTSAAAKTNTGNVSHAVYENPPPGCPPPLFAPPAP